MLIQSELYESYLKHLKVDDEAFPGVNLTEALHTEKEETERDKVPTKKDFLPAELQLMLEKDYASKDYYKNKTHNTMTEDFVMALPRDYSQAQHHHAMR